jgi:hypothetical protein
MITKPQASKSALAIIALWFGIGAETRIKADLVINTPTGLTAGDTFRIAFVTDGTTDATSSSISDYNTFVTNDATSQAGGGANVVTYDGTTLTWSAIGSTTTTSAIANIGETGAPVYLADGTEVTTSDTSTGLWSGSLMNNLDQDLNGNGRLGAIWTGTGPTGVAYPTYELGAASGSSIVGAAQFTNSEWITVEVPPDAEFFPMYGISQELTVPQAAVPEPSSMILAATSIGVVGFGIWILRRRATEAAELDWT